ncbi:MAG: hypothetical protein Q9226_007660 [Calogaya cf. arnoldii]
MTCRLSTGDINTVKKGGSGERRATVPADSTRCAQVSGSNSQAGVSSAILDPMRQQACEQRERQSGAVANSGLSVPNLDYLSFGSDSGPIPSYPPPGTTQPSKALMTDEFAGLLSSPALQEPLDGFFSSSDLIGPYMTPPSSTAHFDWGTDPWTMPADMNNQMASQSLQSSTEEEVTSGEEQSSSEMNSEHRGMAMSSGDGLGLEALDVDFSA